MAKLCRMGVLWLLNLGLARCRVLLRACTGKTSWLRPCLTVTTMHTMCLDTMHTEKSLNMLFAVILLAQMLACLGWC